MSLTRNDNNSTSNRFHKMFNLTTHLNDMQFTGINKAVSWKSKTSKMIKTLTNQPNNPNSGIMT